VTNQEGRLCRHDKIIGRRTIQQVLIGDVVRRHGTESNGSAGLIALFEGFHHGASRLKIHHRFRLQLHPGNFDGLYGFGETGGFGVDDDDFPHGFCSLIYAAGPSSGADSPS
jgi:hypothetical protein